MLSTLGARFGSLRPSMFQAARRGMSSTTGAGPENPPSDNTKTPSESSSVDEKKLHMANILSNAAQQQQQQNKQQQQNQTSAPLPKSKTSLTPSKFYENAMYTRQFVAKTTYQPRDLSEMSVLQASRKTSQVSSSNDPFVALGINPLKNFKNTNLLANFITEMGKIKPRYKTGLTAKSQRRLSKAIKRARAFGLMPVTTRPYFMYNYKTLGRNGSQY
ncbi:hypothetical protein FB645_000195 [Coemansia sp. IMI 203386]|nr:hypothetical protein FB645_000195 [Coemansia sp. IMI 203386]